MKSAPICYINHDTGESDHMNAHIQTEQCRVKGWFCTQGAGYCTHPQCKPACKHERRRPYEKCPDCDSVLVKVQDEMQRAIQLAKETDGNVHWSYIEKWLLELKK